MKNSDAFTAKLDIAHLVAWAFLVFVIGLCVGQPFFSDGSANAMSEAQYMAPSGEHWFGTDLHGRDMFARVIFGTRISLLVGLAGATVSLVVGVGWGAIAGYLGGRWDGAMMRFVDFLNSMPSVIFVIVLMAAMEASVERVAAWAGFGNPSVVARFVFLFVGLGAVSWLNMARIVRGRVLSLKSRDFVSASVALGISHTKILLRHILPNAWGVIVVYTLLTIPSVVLYESFLSYLGIGVQPPYASLGSLIAEGAGQINPIRTYWWMVVFPTGAMVGMLLALNVVGERLKRRIS